MRVGFVRNVGLACLAVAALGLTACNDDPISEDPDQTSRISTNPSEMVIPAGRSGQLAARALNETGEPTFAEFADPVVTPQCVTLQPDPAAAVPIQPPGLFLVTAGNTLGTCTIELSSGGLSATVDAIVVADGVELTCPEQVRSSDTGTLTARLTSSTGETVTPFDQATDLEWATDDADVLAVDDAGGFEATLAGAATITGTWTGTEATGTAGRVTREATCTVAVVADVPASASFLIDDAAVTDLGVVDQTNPVVASEFTVAVFDAAGNFNTVPDEITGISVSSADPGIATATATRALLGEEVALTVEVTPVSGGTTTISGTVQTSEGALPFSATVRVVGIATIDAAGPASGLVGEIVTLDLTGLEDVHEVFIDGTQLDDIFVESRTANQIVFWMPFVGVGTHEIAVGREGALSDPFEFDLTSSGSADSPAFLDPGTAPLTALPLKKVAFQDADQVDHFYLIELAADATIVIDLDWDTGADLDILVTDAGVTAFECTDGATSAQPEQSTCELTAGQHQIWINDFDEAPATYVLEAAIQ
ncbi:MAG: hypothetical protein RRA92_03690 [Gemmatimonadota bacterium]|nr:hypothetical protein [Gemmatimonadota bacterium]